MDDSAFQCHLFPTFPEEIRLQIWRDSFPEPRIIDLKLINSRGNPLFKSNRISDGPWYWASTSSLVLPLLQVNREARSITLESYKATNIRQLRLDGLGWKNAYIDFHRDTLYRACYQCDPLFQFDLPKDTITNNASTWSCDTKNLALHLTVLQPARYIEHGAWIGSFNSPEGRKHAIRSLLSVCMHFPALQQIWLVIDGRDDRFSGNPQIIDPSTIDPGWSLKFALRAISLIVDDLKIQQPDLDLPRIELRLLMNGEDNEMIERRWCYETADCTFIDPSTGRIAFPISSSSRVDSVYTYDLSDDSDSDEENMRVVSGCDLPNNGRVEYLDYGRVGGTYHCSFDIGSDSE